MECTSCTVRLKLGKLPLPPHLDTALQMALIQPSLRQNEPDATAAAKWSKTGGKKEYAEAET